MARVRSGVSNSLLSASLKREFKTSIVMTTKRNGDKGLPAGDPAHGKYDGLEQN
jgi:hypothetical protein